MGRTRRGRTAEGLRYQVLGSGEQPRRHGVARDVLTRRLNALLDSGVVEKVAYQEKGVRTRYEYRLTAAGEDLRAVLAAFMD